MAGIHMTCKADTVMVKLDRKLSAAWKDLWQQLNRGMSMLFFSCTTLRGYIYGLPSMNTT